MSFFEKGGWCLMVLAFVSLVLQYLGKMDSDKVYYFIILANQWFIMDKLQ